MLNYNLITSLLVSIILIAISFYVFFKDWRSQINRYYLFYNIAGSGILFTMFLAYAFPDILDLTLLYKYIQMFTVIFFGSFLAVSLVFPKSGFHFPFYKTVILLAPSFIIGALIIFTDLTIARAYFVKNKLICESGPFYTVYAIIMLIYLLAGIVNFIRKYLKIKNQFHRVQIRMVYIWISILFVIAFFFSIMVARFLDFPTLYVIIPSLLLFISGISLFFSVITHNIPDTKPIIYKTAMYIVAFLLAATLTSAIIIMYENKIWILDQMPAYLISGFIVFILVLFSINVHAMIDMVFKKYRRASGEILNNLLENIAHIRNVEEIIKKAVDILYSSFRVKYTLAIIFDKETNSYKPFYFKGVEQNIKPMDIDSPVIKWFERNNDLLDMDRIYSYYDKINDIIEDINNITVTMNARVILPLFNDKQIIGIIYMGEKDSRSSYKIDEIKILQEFINQASHYIANALAYEEWSQGQIVKGILDLSSEILSNAIPLNLPKIPEISFGAFYIPRYREGIDYFDFFRPTNIGVGVIATDISGRGINNSIYSVILRSAFHSCIEDSHSTFITMQRLNNTLYAYTKGQGQIVKAYYFYYNINTMRLAYTNASYQSLEIYRVETNSFESLDIEGSPLGADLNTNYGMGRTNLLIGDIGFLYSRALIDSKNQNGENFGLTQLREIIKENRRKHPSEITSIIKEKFSSFMGSLLPTSNILVIIFKV